MGEKLYLSGRGARDNETLYCFIDEEDKDLEEYRWYFNEKTQYVFRMEEGKTIYLHKCVAKRKYPEERDWWRNGEKLTVDHINRCRIDNTRDNIRLATRSEQQLNRALSINNKSGYTGVSYEKKRKMWKADITIQRENINLGRYEEKSDAVRIRRLANYIKMKMRAEDVEDLRDELRVVGGEYLGLCSEEERKEYYKTVRRMFKHRCADGV